jgi:hypothetical protein
VSEIPIYGARDIVGVNLDTAVHEVAPNDNFMWEITTVMMGTPSGPHPQSLVILTGPSPILGTGSLIATAGVDLRDMLQIDNAVRVIRDLASYLREMRSGMLAGGNGKFELPDQG